MAMDGDSGTDWFGENAPDASGDGNSFGNPTYDRIAAIFRSYGIEPTRQLVSQWGQNIDQNYENKIRTAIAQMPGAHPVSTSAPATTSTPSTQGDPNAFRDAWFASGGKNVTDLAAFVKAHPEYGATVTGSKGSKVQFANGQAFQAVRSAGINGGIGAAWDDLSAEQPPSLLDPFPEAAPTIAPFQPPPDFVAPTADQAFNDQGFQFTLQQGKDALERSAAAKGSLLTTGTLKDLNDYAQGAASTQYDKVYTRDLGEYENKYGHAETNYDRDRANTLQDFGLRHDLFNEAQDRPFSKLVTLAGFGNGLDNGSNYAANAGNTLTGIGNASAAGTVGASNAYNTGIGNLGNLGAYYASIYANRNRYQPYGPGY